MPPRYHEISAKSIARPSGIVDPWFLGRFGLNLYRGCEHACVYCDGRAERYYVTGDFATDIQVKSNAPEILARELSTVREPGFVFLGGGVCDAYQPAEAKFGLARKALELILARGLSVHVLTKSALVERDLDLLTAINVKARAILSFSLIAEVEGIRERFEPGAAPFAERLRLLQKAKAMGLGTGVMAMPLLPGLTDQPEVLENLFRSIQTAGADFIGAGGLTLRPGIQKQGYLRVIEEHYPDLLAGYERVYREARSSGAPDPRYAARLEARCRAALAGCGLPGRIPWALFRRRVPLYAELGVLLEHQGFEQGETGWGTGPCAKAGLAIQSWAQSRLKRSRSRSAYREVEGELVWMAKAGNLGEIPGIPPGTLPAVVQMMEEISG